MSVSLALVLSLIYIAALFGAAFYNHYKSRRDLFLSSVFVLGMFVVAHLGNSLWLMSLPLEEVLGLHYLFFAGIQAVIAAGLFLLNREKIRVIMSLTITLLVVEAMFGYAVHLDRNIVALNGAAVPNVSGANAWLLWDMRNYLSQVTTFTLFLALTLSNVYQVKTEDNTQAFEILEDVERYVKPFKANESKERTSIFLEMSVQNLFEPNDTLRDKQITKVGVYLLNEAIRECCYEPHRKQPVNAFGRFIYWLRS